MRSLRLPFDFAVALAPTVLVGCGLLLAQCRREPPPSPPVTLASGLIVQDLRVGSGSTPADGSYVAVHYDARILAVEGAPQNDPPYDSTRREDPFVAKLGRTPLLPGFEEGLRGMKQGGQRRMTLPPDLAYGAIGKGRVPPGATLEYVVDLVGVFTQRPSGVQYWIVREGEGDPPVDGDRIVANFRAWLVETGREVSSSRALGRALEFELGSGQALKGLDDALHAMKRGGRWIVAVPPELGYGLAGQWPMLLPNQDVLFDLELTGVRPR